MTVFDDPVRHCMHPNMFVACAAFTESCGKKFQQVIKDF